MRISVSSPKFKDEFSAGVRNALRKKAYSDISTNGDMITVLIKVDKRITGKYGFLKDGDEARLVRFLDIDTSYNPFELAINDLVKYFKHRTVKYIVI